MNKEQKERICSRQCTTDGCWGPDDQQCLRCRHHKHGRRCISNCSSLVGHYVDNSTMECSRCHEECLYTTAACFGPVKSISGAQFILYTIFSRTSVPVSYTLRAILGSEQLKNQTLSVSRYWNITLEISGGNLCYL